MLFRSRSTMMTDLEKLREKCLACRLCPVGGKLIEGHLSNVFSNMNEQAKLMVVGQNAGRTEVIQGEPFVGQAGEFFNQAIKDCLGVGRETFYITNACHCLTPGNRRPSDQELKNCRALLDQEIALIQPRAILTLGSVALRQITGMVSITKKRGQILRSIRYGCPVIPLLHPSPLNINNDEKQKTFMEDLSLVKEFL